jgi:hypothetical protein
MKLGNIIDKAGLTRSNLMEAAKLGVGAGLFPFAYGLIQKGLLRASPTMFAQGTYSEYATRALSGVILGSVTTRVLKQGAMGDGMVASAVGSVFRDIAAPLFNPAAKAQQAAVTATEAATGEAQMSGVNPLGRGLAGLNGLSGFAADPSLLFGVGTPDMSASRMFSGATVAIEQGGMSGATVAIEPQQNFAGVFS